MIDAYGLRAPLPRILCATREPHKLLEEHGWRIYSPRHAPRGSLEAHLTFALKYEGLDLAILKCLFLATGSAPIEELVKAKPTGAYARRIWFLCEWLAGRRLNLPNADRRAYPTVLDPDRQFAARPEVSPRHRVKNNLPGTPEFCPLVFRTDAMERFVAMDLQARAQETSGAIPRDLLVRTAAVLLHSRASCCTRIRRSSFAVEGEHPPQDRIQRWGRAIGLAGQQPIDLDELLRLQRIVIGDARFVRLGLRTEGGFVGERDRQTRMPMPVHISARPDDLAGLVKGMISFDKRTAPQLDPVVAASTLAFGLVYTHPFEDGNGRLHRYLIHHVLARRGLQSTAGMSVFRSYRRQFWNGLTPYDWVCLIGVYFGGFPVRDRAVLERPFAATPRSCPWVSLDWEGGVGSVSGRASRSALAPAGCGALRVCVGGWRRVNGSMVRGGEVYHRAKRRRYRRQRYRRPRAGLRLHLRT